MGALKKGFHVVANYLRLKSHAILQTAAFPQLVKMIWISLNPELDDIRLRHVGGRRR